MRVARLHCELELRQPASQPSKRTWCDEMIKVPNGVVCAAVNGEVFIESGQSIRPEIVKETIKTHQ